MDVGIAGIIVAIILGACSIVTSIIFGYVPRKRQRESIQAKTELLQLYKDVSQLLDVEQQLLDEADISKIKARHGQAISNRCKPSNVRKRINELSTQLQKYGTI